MHQYFGAFNTSFGTIFQYATTTIKSNHISSLKKSVLFFNISGCNTFILLFSANIFTGVGVIIFFLPTGLSG